MRYLFILSLFIAFQAIAQNESDITFRFFKSNVVIPKGAEIVPVPTGWGFVFSYEGRIPEKYELFSYEQYNAKFFDASFIADGELEKKIIEKCGLKIVERRYVDSTVHPAFTAHMQQPDNFFAMAAVYSSVDSGPFQNLMVQYCVNAGYE